MYRWLVFLLCVSLCGKLSYQFNGTELINKIFNRPQESISKFPPIIEFFVQKIQSQFSNYVYEDLSRPPTWEKPVYTLSPEDQAAFFSTSTTNTTRFNEDDFEYVDTDNSTEIFFEIIVNKNHNPDSTNTVEYHNTDETLVYITPKKPFTTTPKTLQVT